MDPFFTLYKNSFKFFLHQNFSFIKDDIHFNEEGNRIVAKNFLKIVQIKIII